MIYQSECRFCKAETEWAEPHMYHLPRNHPKREWANLSVCGECNDAYGPPLMFEEWETVQFNIVSCHFCHTKNVAWIGTADWANPKMLLQHCIELMDESNEAVNLTTDLLKQVTKVTSICRKCARSKSEKEIYQLIRQDAKRAALEQPAWEPIETDDISLDDELDEK